MKTVAKMYNDWCIRVVGKAMGRANANFFWIAFLLFFAWGLYMWAKSGFRSSNGQPIQP